MRSVAVVVTLSFALSSQADENKPGALPEDKRREVVADWKAAYSAHKEKIQGDIDEAKKAITFPATATEGRKKLAIANNAMSELRKSPFDFVVGFSKKSLPGRYARFARENTIGSNPPTVKVIAAGPDGVTLQGRAESMSATFVLEGPAPKEARAGYRIPMPGLYYIREIDRNSAALTFYIQRVVVDAKEMPK